MPIYEYRCGACGHTLDWLQKVSDPPLELCPACNETSLKRLISAPSFRLKGSGWYETDFKSDKNKRRNLAESGGGDASDKPKEGEKSKSDDKSGASGDKPSKKSEETAGKPKPKTGTGSEAA